MPRACKGLTCSQQQAILSYEMMCTSLYVGEPLGNVLVRKDEGEAVDMAQVIATRRQKQAQIRMHGANPGIGIQHTTDVLVFYLVYINGELVCGAYKP